MTEEEKRKAAVQHVVHDYANLVSARTEICRFPKPPLNSHVQYSFLVGCRKFGIFFSSTPPRHKDEIVACHFLRKKVSFDLTEWSKWRDHMNVHLLHLSYGRVDDTRPWTGYDDLNKEILEEFRAAWKKFRAHVHEPYKAEFAKQVFYAEATSFLQADLGVSGFGFRLKA